MPRIGPVAQNSWQVSADHADLVRPIHAARPVTIAAAPKAMTLDLARTAIIVIDMQNDFCTPGGWLDGIGVDVGPARRPIDPLNRTLPILRRAGVPVMWVNWATVPIWLTSPRP